MIPTLGFIVATYALARLLQVPIENSRSEVRWVALLVISIPSMLVISFLALDLFISGSRSTSP
jgi:hypothetical protein